MTSSEITAALQLGLGKWTGCHWPTQFGESKLNLQGLLSRQAALMARASTGREAEEWRNAVQWLEAVERDAREAEAEATTAATLASQGAFEQALEHVERACALEAHYNDGAGWAPLRNLIAAACCRTASGC